MKRMADRFMKHGNTVPVRIYSKLFVRNSAQRISWLKLCGASMGEGCTVNSDTGNFMEPYMVRFGKKVYVAANCHFITHDGAFSWMSRAMGVRKERTDKLGEIVVGDNCFIDFGSMIMPNVTIGSNCIIAAGAVVTKSVPDYSVVGGCQARRICSTDEYMSRNAHLNDYTCGLSNYEKRKYYEKKRKEQNEEKQV